MIRFLRRSILKLFTTRLTLYFLFLGRQWRRRRVRSKNFENRCRRKKGKNRKIFQTSINEIRMG